MDFIRIFHILHGGFGIIALIVAIITLTMLWRLRGMLQWKRSLRLEFRKMKAELASAGPGRRQAVEVVLNRCRDIWDAGFPEFTVLFDLDGYIRDIATAFHPEQEKPELCVTTGSLIRTAHDGIQRLQAILNRPGFSRFQHLRIRHVRKAWNWYNRISQYRVIRAYIRYRKWIGNANILRLILLPDPFSWLIYLSNQLTILSLTRFFLMDIYLFVGRQAIQAYNHEVRPDILSQDENEIEAELAELADLKESEFRPANPRIQEIRNRLVGVNAMIFPNAGVAAWKSGLIDALHVIAETYFPDSPVPVDEAKIGPMLIRCRYWLQSISETERNPVMRRLHRIEIRYLYSVKAIADHPAFRRLGVLTRTSWNVYQWMQWPLFIFRIIRKTTPTGMAASVGWMMLQKGAVNYMSRKAFDLTIKEMETVFFLSGDDGAEKQETETGTPLSLPPAP